VRLRAARAELFEPAQSAKLNEELPDGAKRLCLDDGLAIELYFGSAHRNGQGGIAQRAITKAPQIPPQNSPMRRAYHPNIGGSSSGTDPSSYFVRAESFSKDSSGLEICK